MKEKLGRERKFSILLIVISLSNSTRLRFVLLLACLPMLCVAVAKGIMTKSHFLNDYSEQFVSAIYHFGSFRFSLHSHSVFRFLSISLCFVQEERTKKVKKLCSTFFFCHQCCFHRRFSHFGSLPFSTFFILVSRAENNYVILLLSYVSLSLKGRSSTILYQQHARCDKNSLHFS